MKTVSEAEGGELSGATADPGVTKKYTVLWPAGLSGAINVSCIKQMRLLIIPGISKWRLEIIRALSPGR